jgi:hypothetical protein
MIVDLDRDRFALRSAYDVCIVGAGPVGITMAAELADRGCSVIVVESGDVVPRASRTRLAAGEVVGDDRYGPLEIKVHRAVGGTSWLWENALPGGVQGVRHTMIEPAVLERHRDDGRNWPFDSADLAAFTTRALHRAGVVVGVDQLRPHPSTHVAGLDQGRYVFGPRRQFQLDGLGSSVARQATLLTTATVVSLATRHGGPRDAVDHVVVRSEQGRQATIRATTFVLAAGTVENTRLALMLGNDMAGVRANRVIGTGMMDRPRLTGAFDLDVDPPEWLAAFGVHTEGGVPSMSRFLVPADAVRAGGASCSLLPMPAPQVGPARRWFERRTKQALVAAPTAFEQRIADHVGRRTARGLIEANRGSYPARSWLYRHLATTSWDLEWSAWPSTGTWRSTRSWALTAIIEQFPHPANRLELADRRDVHGRPIPRLVWGRPVERGGDVGVALAMASDALAAAGLGRARWPASGFDAVSSCHLMGSLPMGDDPTTSATDPAGRLRGTANVFAAGSCLFPTGGHSNPTLTGLALAIATADHITSASTRIEVPASAAG